jgi:hypothetical protein
MSRVRIYKKDGTATPYFWLEKDKESPTSKTVYKRASDGVKRMRGVHFDPVTNRMHKD